MSCANSAVRVSGLTYAPSLWQKLTLSLNPPFKGRERERKEEHGRERKVELVKSDSVCPHKGIENVRCLTRSPPDSPLTVYIFIYKICNLEERSLKSII